jgi:hypothetical protein
VDTGDRGYDGDGKTRAEGATVQRDQAGEDGNRPVVQVPAFMRRRKIRINTAEGTYQARA